MNDATSSDPHSVATLAAYAQRYAGLGWHVLPLEPGKKQPCGRLVPRGMLDASIDPDVIANWWRKVPDAGIGISLAQSGLVALDIDPRNGGAETWDDLQAKHGSLRSQVSAYTGGGGEHHVFVVPPGVHVSLPGMLGPGVDVKANGYIVVEPSTHPSGTRYEWEASSSPLDGVVPSPLPDWLRNLRISQPQPQREPATRPIDARTAQEVREALYSVNADDRDDWLRAGMALHATGWGHQAYAMWCAWSQLSDKFDAKDQDRVWASFRDTAGQTGQTGQTGLSIAWIFKRAQEAGWVNPRARIHEAPQESSDSDRFGDELLLPLDAEYATEKPPKSALPILTADELRQTAGSIAWTVKHVVPADSLGVLFGASGTFKSFLALDLALHIAHGMPWMGKKTKRGSVLIVAAEGGAGIWRRIEAWHKVHGKSWTDAEILVCPVAADLINQADDLAAAVIAKVGDAEAPAFVLIDTMAQTFSGEENSATDVSNYLRIVSTAIRAPWRAAVLVVHHSGHNATERPRGSSAIRANVDFMLGCHRDEREMLATMSTAKQKDGDTHPDTTFALTVVELGQDEDGDAITSLVARAVMDEDEKAEIVMKEATKGRSGRNSTILAMAQNGMNENDLRKAFCETVEGDADTRRQAYFRARKWAVNNGLLDFAEGYVLILKKGPR